MPRTIHARPVAIAVLALATTAVATLVVPASQAAESTLSSTQRIEIGGYTDSSLALGLTINDGKASRYPSNTGPTGLAGKVTDVRCADRGFSHERPRDVDILLVAPNGQAVVLMSDVGGTTPVIGLDLTFDDQASAEVDPAAVPQTGTWRPSNEGTDDVFLPRLPSPRPPRPCRPSTVSAPAGTGPCTSSTTPSTTSARSRSSGSRSRPRVPTTTRRRSRRPGCRRSSPTST